MKMRLILLASSFLLLSCAGRLPAWPEIKQEYIFDIDPSGKMSCLKFEIVSLDPYTIRFRGEVPLAECSGLSGFVFQDRVKFNKWLADTQKYAKELRCR